MQSHPALRVIYGEIESRTRAIATAHPGWPCRKGCDLCCRRLADIPRVTLPEWELLAAGLAALPEDVRRETGERIAALTAERPVVCPFLDQEAGACLVYEYRPAACRTYGFYVERDGGLYCEQIREMAESGACDDVVWGNAAAIDTRLDAFGERVDIRSRHLALPSFGPTPTIPVRY